MSQNLYPTRLGRSHLRSAKGFSLVELLAVIGIISILVATSVPSISSVFQSNQVDGNLTTISGIFEQAREAAISGNTYVYVVFSGPLPATGGGVAVAVIGAQDGTDALKNFTTTGAINATNSDLQLLRKVQTLPGIQLLTKAQANALSVSSFTASSTQTVDLQQSLSLSLNTAGNTYTFTQAIEFAPDGEARVQNWSDLVEFGLKSAINSQSHDVAVVTLTRLTGKFSVYRP